MTLRAFLFSVLLWASTGGFGGSSMAEPAQTLDCLDWRQIRDADFVQHAQTFANIDPCVGFEPFEAAGVAWRLVRLQRTATIPQTGPLVVVLHDNEDASFLAALSLLARYDLQVVALDTGEERLFSNLDPNRMFVEPGAVINGCPSPERLDTHFAQAVLRDWNGRAPILSLHSNAPGYSGDGQGGRGTISLNKIAPGQRGYQGARDPQHPRLRDPDNLVFIVGPDGQPGPTQSLHIRSMQAAGLNVLYSQIDPLTQDCSLSDFLSLRGQSELYFNAEVEEGDFQSAITMVERLMNVLYNFPQQNRP